MKKNVPVRIENGLEIFQSFSVSRSPREYIFIKGKKTYYHIYLAETFIRPLAPGEVIHHKDGNPLNNELSNLEALTRADHVRIHKPVTGYKFTKVQRQKLSDSHKGQKAWNKGQTGFRHTKESRQNMSLAQKGRAITWGDKISEAKTKVTKEQLVKYLMSHPDATMAQVMNAFGLKSHQPIFKHGGLKKLKAREL